MLSLAPKQRRSKNWSKGIKHPAWHSRNTPQRARKAGKYLAWPLTNCSNSSNTFFFRRYENSTPFTIICATHTLPCYYHTSLDLVVFLLTVLTRCPICQEDGCLKMAMRPVPVQITTSFARKSVSIFLWLQWPLKLCNIQTHSKVCQPSKFDGFFTLVPLTNLHRSCVVSSKFICEQCQHFLAILNSMRLT